MACVTPRTLLDTVLGGASGESQGSCHGAQPGSYIAKEGRATRYSSDTKKVFTQTEGYAEEGTLVPRTEEGAFIETHKGALERVTHDGCKGRQRS